MYTILQLVLVFLGVISPSLVALGLMAKMGMPGSVNALPGCSGKWRVNIVWCVFAASYIAVIKLLIAIIYRAITCAWPPFGGAKVGMYIA